MSIRKLDLFTLLAIICFLNAGRSPDVQTMRHQTRPDSQYLTLLNADGSLSRADRPARAVIRRQTDIARETSFTHLLLVQSRNSDDLAMGKLLVASRGLADPIFAKTVVLLVQYDSESVVGLMMNKRTEVPLSQVFKEYKSAKNRSDPAYAGGPVDLPTVFALLRSKTKPEGAQQMFAGVYLISTKSEFEKNLSAPPDPGIFRVYLGYAGWTPEQLRQEIRLGAWFIFQGNVDAVFNSNPDSLWPQMIRRTELKMAGNRLGRSDNAVLGDTALTNTIETKSIIAPY